MNQTAETTVTTAHFAVPARGCTTRCADGAGGAAARSPMDATSFAPLADRLATDHTVVTLDPRQSTAARSTTVTRTPRRGCGPTTWRAC